MIKVKDRKLLLLPGDGIGPEVMREVKKIIEWFNKNKSLDFKIEEDLVGGASYDKHKNPITDEVFYKALESEAVILGAVGGPKYDNLEFSKRPERALLKLRSPPPALLLCWGACLWLCATGPGVGQGYPRLPLEPGTQVPKQHLPVQG